MLAGAGAVLGVLLAQWLSRFLVAFLSTEYSRLFLDLRPGDAGPARELATVLGVPFVTPHGVPWHRATGAALVAARQDAPPPVPGSATGSGRHPSAAQ